MTANDVIVSVSGIQYYTGSEDNEPVVVTVPGSHFIQHGKHYLLYDEVMEPEHLLTHNTLKVSDDGVELIKKGSVNSRMCFEVGKKNVSYVNLPYGTLMMEIETKNIEVNEDEDKLRVRIDYILECADQKLGDAVVIVEAFSKASGEFKLI